MARVVALPLAPLLVWQGRRVRRDTPRLPEAPGEREGAVLRWRGRGDDAIAGGAGPIGREQSRPRQVVRILLRVWVILGRLWSQWHGLFFPGGSGQASRPIGAWDFGARVDVLDTP
jgi:hypothetical protein